MSSSTTDKNNEVGVQENTPAASQTDPQEKSVDVTIVESSRQVPDRKKMAEVAVLVFHGTQKPTWQKARSTKTLSRFKVYVLY